VVSDFGKTSVRIDVEKIKPANFKVAERFFSKAEITDINKLEGFEKNKYFFDLWTLKESYLKLLGKGLTKALNTFTVRNSADGFTLKDTFGKTEKVFFKQYYPDDNHICSVCSFSNQFIEKPEILFPENLI